MDVSSFMTSFEMGLFSLKPEERISKSLDFIALKLHGKRHYTKHFSVIIKENERGDARLGIAVSKRIGNAVRRNRIKRLAREFFRLNKHRIPKGYDVMIIALKNCDKLTFVDTQEELGDLLLKNHDVFS